jgi:hypothetical protein
MKKIFLGSFILSLLLLLSCKDNTMNNPVSSDQGAIQKSTDHVRTGSITLDRILELPGKGNTYYQINGEIKYTEDLISQGVDPTTSKADVKLDLALDAKITNPEAQGQDNGVLDVFKESINEIYVSPEGMYLLQKTYPIQSTTYPLELVCTYIVTTDAVNLNNIELKIPSPNDK